MRFLRTEYRIEPCGWYRGFTVTRCSVYKTFWWEKVLRDRIIGETYSSIEEAKEAIKEDKEEQEQIKQSKAAFVLWFYDQPTEVVR